VARAWNKNNRTGAFYAGLLTATVLSIAGCCALAAGPILTRMDPSEHVYRATVWLLIIWTGLHAALGAIMQLYCLARRAAGRMTAKYDIDIHNVALYWHFVAIMVTVTVMVILRVSVVAMKVLR
jgi:cytochrome c oxidase subunit I+III